MAPSTARPMISTPVIASCLGQQRDAPRARFALRSLAGGEQPPLLRPAVKPAEAHSREDDHEIDRRYEHGEPPSLPARRTDPSVTSVVMPEATVPALRSASGPRTNSGAGQTMHPARPVRQKNEAQPTRAPGHPVTGRRPLAGSARLADRDGRPTASAQVEFERRGDTVHRLDRDPPDQAALDSRDDGLAHPSQASHVRLTQPLVVSNGHDDPSDTYAIHRHTMIAHAHPRLIGRSDAGRPGDAGDGGGPATGATQPPGEPGDPAWRRISRGAGPRTTMVRCTRSAVSPGGRSTWRSRRRVPDADVRATPSAPPAGPLSTPGSTLPPGVPRSACRPSCPPASSRSNGARPSGAWSATRSTS